MMVACGQPRISARDHSCLRVAVVVRLQASKNQVELFVLDRRGNRTRRIVGIEAGKLVVFEVNRAVGAFGQRFA